MTCSIVRADAIEFLNQLPADSVDLVFGSPPYEEARLYLEGGENLGISRKTEDWVAWMVQVYGAAQRCCKGLVAFVVAGQTRDFRWSAGPALLAADLHRAGFCLRNPPIFHRVGIPGSGGPDWLRSDYEWIICTARPGKLPWSDNTACGHPPKWAPGGEMSYRLSDGTRTNQWGKTGDDTGTTVHHDGVVTNGKARPSHVTTTPKTFKAKKRMHTKAKPDGSDEIQAYAPPVLANPGNVISLIVGGGVMGGDAFCSQNEAPFPEALAEFFVQSFCPQGGTVCDPFSGSGTTASVSVRHGRNFAGCDLRQSQVDLGLKRVAQETPLGLFTETEA